MLLFGVAAILAGALIAGLGFGGGFLGALRTFIPLVSPGEREALMAAFYVECYLANSLPAIAAGLGVQRWGLLVTANLYALAAIELLAFWLTRRRWASLAA